MKFNHLTAAEMHSIYEHDRKRLDYIQKRMLDLMVSKDYERYSRGWHDPQGYEYYIIAYQEGDKYMATIFLVAGYKGVERFLTLCKHETGEYHVIDYTNHFLLRFHNRVIATKKVDRVNAYLALWEYHKLTVNEISLCVYRKKNEFIYATAEGLIFAADRKGILHYKTFVGTEQLKDNQTEAISMVFSMLKEYRHLDYVLHRGSIAFDEASKPLTDQLVALQPQLELLLTNYGRRKRKA